MSRIAYEKYGVSSLALIAVMGLAGCNVGPKYTRPQVPPPPAFRGADDAAVSSDPNGSLGDQQWSTVFKQPELQALIREALTNNFDLRAAAQRVLQQESQVKITRAQQFPQINGGGTGAGVDLPSTVGTSINSPLVFGSFNLSASWTPDFWGLYRKQTEAARDQLLAQQWAQRAVRMTLVQQVATTYFQLRTLDQQLAIAKETLKTRQESVKLTQTLERGGSVPLSDVRQAEQLLYTASSQIPQLEQQIQQGENDLRLLLGKEPGPVSHADPNAITPVPDALPVGIPSQLIERRPDIQQAEAKLKAANAQVGAARAQFFPQLSISGSAGFGGDEFSNLFDPSGKTIYGLGSLTQPIFAGGKIRGQYDLSKRQKDELILTYQKAVYTGFHDVSSALIAVNKQRRAREQQQLLVTSAQDATRLARLRYQGGSTSYLEVLTTDSNLFSAQLNLASAQQNEALTLVQLYSALGGGWQ
ncbi:efflux transporter, outer membrane factor lipoprotein, NodT family [Terriglobus roseus DSM 18391]|uniref:Efflux transporter, outer membrane factor lipoprotein, NodT family n=1 Tax=Terriglobus roseus (strain DSM 18391 / NRRL B-41598 / KBS 63) TaxID=926566 RepID=I3ZHQ6_TERRK|nr:efflux transporter outer membrane subunit [Terriglobus roseus]AFL88432.1 efflux transporter, outer membrane factor lipoprotein, NodT family [Terriglobus roseus DSM 18391]AFL88774.1 efflux transporter, outer membrane factor lipoprotein, NodT family [Terriglobus roseus DSM 18391]